MCTVATVTQYNEQKKWMDEITNLFPDIARWVALWDTRKYHIFPAFLKFGYSNATLTKSGSSTLKFLTQIWNLLKITHCLRSHKMKN